MKKHIWTMTIILFVTLAVIFYPKEKGYEYYETVSNVREVEIKGAVLNPGKYQVSEGTTVGHLIYLAGGPLPNADISNLHLSGAVTEPFYMINEYYVNQKEVMVKVNINEVNFQDLIRIPNITETRAINILIYRNDNGKFTSIDQLMEVKGIGAATFEKIKIYFRI